MAWSLSGDTTKAPSSCATSSTIVSSWAGAAVIRTRANTTRRACGAERKVNHAWRLNELFAEFNETSRVGYIINTKATSAFTSRCGDLWALQARNVQNRTSTPPHCCRSNQVWVLCRWTNEALTTSWFWRVIQLCRCKTCTKRFCLVILTWEATNWLRTFRSFTDSISTRIAKQQNPLTTTMSFILIRFLASLVMWKWN